jgi:hypothetical protein
LTNDRDQLVAEIEVLNRDIAMLGFELATVYQREKLTIDNIAATHGGPGKFNPANADKRAPWFENLTEIACKYGPKKQLHKDMKRRVRAYTKEVLAIDKAAQKKETADVGKTRSRNARARADVAGDKE